VPANSERFIAKVPSINADYFVLDLEDSIILKDIQKSVDLITGIPELNRHFVRTPVNLEAGFFNRVMIRLFEAGFTHFVIPKIESKEDIQKIEEISVGIRKHYIGLIESPLGLIKASQIVETTGEFIGLGFGSHDYCKTMNMDHTNENIYFPRLFIHNLAKAFNLNSIDIASMEIEDMSQFEKDIEFAFSSGFDGKFVIHPRQLDRLNQKEYLTPDLKSTYYTIYEMIKDKNIDELPPFTYRGRLYERPHFIQIKEIIERMNNR
jgi:citrate lyase beta subunit